MTLKNAFENLAVESKQDAQITQIGAIFAQPIDVALPGLPGLEINQVAVGTVEVAVPAIPLAGRASISVKALAANGAEVYVRRVTVSTTTGWELSAGDSIDIDADDTVAVMAISLSGTQRVCYAEI